MNLEDGKGTGYKAEVDNENNLHTLAIATTLQHHINHEHQELYSIVVSKTPTGAGDCFLYIKNNSDDDMLVCALSAYAATDESIQVKHGDTGTTSGGTANVPVNRNAGSGKTADCTCEDGVDITGLSGGSVVDEVAVDGATGTRKHIWRSDIILPKNATMSLYAVTGAIALKVTLTVAFHS
jgi:hypothetical protein